MTSDPSPRAASPREVRITRVFRAARELVFAAWIDPEQISAWWAPEECEIPRDTVEVDLRVGGRIHFSMVDTDSGVVYPVRFEIVEMSKPELLVLASDADPEIGLDYPMVTRVAFDVEGDGTRVTVIQGPHTEAMEDRAAGGWTGSLDKLERLLNSR